jgi:nicotinamide phosphoribosyltransferase
MCHDFSARGLSPWDMLTSGMGHATSFRGSDTIICIPGARYFYNEPKDEVCINSVNASEHSVSTTKIFTVGEQQMIADWLVDFPNGILSIVSDTFDLWKLITEYLPANKEAIMARDGKLVIRPDSGDPVDIICGREEQLSDAPGEYKTPAEVGVIELLWDIFGGTINEQGYKVLDPHIGAIYGDSITLDRQIEIYKRLEAKGFAATNIVLGVGSFTYQMNTRDTLGFAAKGAWFEVEEFDTIPSADGLLGSALIPKGKVGYNIYKDPVTDDGTKKSLKGLICVTEDHEVLTQCTWEQEGTGILQTIYEDGKFHNQTTLTEIRERLNKL